MEWWKIITAGLIAALGTGWTLKLFFSNRSSRSRRTTIVSQKHNRAGGDIVGGDMHKNNRK